MAWSCVEFLLLDLPGWPILRLFRRQVTTSDQTCHKSESFQLEQVSNQNCSIALELMVTRLYIMQSGFTTREKDTKRYSTVRFNTLCVDDRALTPNVHVMHAHASYIFKKLDIIFTESAMIQFWKCAFFCWIQNIILKIVFFILLYSFIFFILGLRFEIPQAPHA